jgi:hypothetical protein
METINAGFDPLPTNSPNGIDKLGGGFGEQDHTPGNFSQGRPGFDPGRFRDNNGNDTTAPMLLGLGGALLLISIGLLAARLWSRLRPWRLKLDDWAVTGATVSTQNPKRSMMRRKTYSNTTGPGFRTVSRPFHFRLQRPRPTLALRSV